MICMDREQLDIAQDTTQELSTNTISEPYKEDPMNNVDTSEIQDSRMYSIPPPLPPALLRNPTELHGIQNLQINSSSEVDDDDLEAAFVAAQAARTFYRAGGGGYGSFPESVD